LNQQRKKKRKKKHKKNPIPLFKKMNILNQSNEMYCILIFSLCIDGADLSKKRKKKKKKRPKN
jgi:hypothetical protein